MVDSLFSTSVHTGDTSGGEWYLAIEGALNWDNNFVLFFNPPLSFSEDPFVGVVFLHLRTTCRVCPKDACFGT